MRFLIVTCACLVVLITPLYAQNGASISLDLRVTDAAFDPIRGTVYVTDKDAKTLSFINLQTGLLEKSISFELMPELLVIDPQGERLYVVLLTREHSSFWFEDEGHTGDIAVIDLDTQTLVDQFTIDTDPYDLVVTSDGYLYVSHGSGQWGPIKSYNLQDPSVAIGRGGTYELSILRLHPDESRLYVANTGLIPSDVERFTINQGEFAENWDSPYHGDHRFDGHIFIHPDGEYMLSRGGDIFSLSETREEDLIYQQSIKDAPVTDAAYDTGTETLFTIVDSTIAYYDLPAFFQRGIFPLRDVGQFLSVVDDTVYVLSGTSESSSYLLEKFAHPGIGSGNDNSPVIKLAVLPGAEGTTQTTFTFDTSGTSDNATPGDALLFRWDLNGDGNYDTDFEPVSEASWRYTLAGSYTIRLEVKDEEGYLSAMAVEINVIYEPDPGMKPGVTVPFYATDVVYDYQKSIAYVSAKQNNALYRVHLQTGEVVTEYTFDYMPEFMALSPDSSTLYLALLTREHDPYWFDREGHEGLIATFDMETAVKTNQYLINEDPYGLVATSDGYLYVTSGSGQTSYMRSYQATDGTEVKGEYGIRAGVRLQLNAEENVIYGARFGNHHGDLLRWTVESGQFEKSWYAPFKEDFRVGGDLFIRPNGDKLITRGSDVFSTSVSQASDLVFLGRLSEDRPVLDVAYDTEEQAIFALYGTELRYYNESNLIQAGSIDLGLTGRSVGVHGDSIFVFAHDENNVAHLLQFENPMFGASSNTLPAALFSVDPPEGNTRTVFTFDASESSDLETEVDELQVRWDWDSDGVFDTPFDAEKVVQHQFLVQGTYAVTMEIKDQFAGVSTLTKELTIPFEPDPGQTPDSTHTPFELPVDVDDVLFDPVQPYLYATSKAQRKVFTVNLETGLIERTYSFGFMPESMTIDPAGETLYIALLTREHNLGWFDNHFAYIAQFDLDSQTLTDQFVIDEDPADMVVTSDGYLYVTGGSGQWTRLASYRLSDRSFVSDKSSLYQGARVKLHPDGRKLYVATTRLSPSDIIRYSIDEGQITTSYDSPYHGQYGPAGNVFIHPDGERLISRGTHVFRSTDERSTDMEFLFTLEHPFRSPIEDMYFDEDNGIIFGVGLFGLYRFDYNELTPLGSESFPKQVSYVHAYDDDVYVLSDQGAEGLFIFKLDAVPVSRETSPDLPDVYALDQNFPNPFHTSTRLRLSIPDPSHVTLRLFDLVGREVATLVDKNLQAGYHNVIWSPVGLSTGMYFARMAAGGQRIDITLTYIR